jgi:hypothetical protein
VRSKTTVYAVIAGAALFVSGIAVGQKGPSKFSKYLRPSVRTEMDWIALGANVDAIRETLPQSGGLSVPFTYFNAKENRPQAFVMISVKFMFEPLETVRAEISKAYYAAYSTLKHEIPELSEDDFVLKVMSPTPDHTHKLFAECKHGNIVFH